MTQAPPPAPAGAPVPNPGKGLSIAGMVLGIVACALFCAWYIAIPCAIVGLILSIMGKKKSVAAGAPTGMATAGIILCVIGLGIDVLFAILAIVGLSLFGSKVAEMQKQMETNMPKQMLDMVRMFF
jgi:hypothetical protein